MHLKDIAATPANFGLGMNPADIGAGLMDWPRVLAAAQAAGVQHYFVEQEPPCTRPRLDAARIGFEFTERAMREARVER